MNIKYVPQAVILVILLFAGIIFAAAPDALDSCNLVWTTQSKDSSGSMPCGGGDVGCNVWAENGELLFYISRSGTFDENNTLLKLGRVRLRLTPNPFADGEFRQELKLKEGCVEISGRSKSTAAAATVRLWVEVFRPVIHVEVESEQPIAVEAAYESWRTKDRPVGAEERMQCLSFIGTKPEIIKVITHADRVQAGDHEVSWHHRNDNADLLFDKLVLEQHLESIKDKLWNPQRDFTFGGLMRGDGMEFIGTAEGKYAGVDFTAWMLKSRRPVKEHRLRIFLHSGQTETVDQWKEELRKLAGAATPDDAAAWSKNLAWWRQFWERSHIYCRSKHEGAAEDDPVWRVGRNYQLFRYMLGCNAYGEYPSKFNGGLFTFDPPEKKAMTPDFRLWGGGSFTAQNQRLVYWPMLKSGDFDMMPSQFEFYRRSQANVELSTKIYWGHAGACFAEHPESFGLPIAEIYEVAWGGRPIGPRPGDDHGLLLNPWCEDQYDTVLEFCLMILDVERYAGEDISKYLPLLESCVTFFDEHYQYQCRKRTGKPLDDDGHLVIYPGTACETYKLAENPVTTVAGLRTVLERMLELPEKYAAAPQREKWRAMLDRIPPLSYREIAGRKTIAPAKSWKRINNIEFPQMYPVFPYGIYGLGKPDLQVAIDTWQHGAENARHKQNHCWFQSGIFCARLGLTDESAKLLIERFNRRSMRFPAFWDTTPFCQCPDFDHGGAGMVHLQESLMQTSGREIRLLPAWHKNWDADFKLHAPYNTVVECKYRGGKVVSLDVTPPERAADVILPAAE